jgi:hypothetical protein
VSTPGFSHPLTVSSHRGIYAPYRYIASFGQQALGLVDPGPGDARIEQIAAITGRTQLWPLMNDEVPPSAYGLDNWVPVYTFQYDFTDLTERSVTFGWREALPVIGTAAITGWDDQGTITAEEVLILGEKTYTVQIAPTPGGAGLLALLGVAAARRTRVR